MTATAADVRLRVSEIFFSLQGESTRVGLPTVFVRLTGCPLRCDWCDTTYAFSGGETLALPDILDRVAACACPTVCVTGGEPLAQAGCHALLVALCDAGYSVSLETSGALDISGVDARVAAGFGFWQMAFGSKAELTSANLRAAYTAMTNFTDDEGRKLNIRPTHLIVGNTNHFKARDILMSEQVNGTTNTDRNLVQLMHAPLLG